MDLTEEAAADVTIVAIAGRLDSRTAPRLGDRLSELLRSGEPHLLIETSAMRYISSAGLRALLVAAKGAAEKGGGLAVCGMTPPIRRVIELAGLHEIFQMHASREEALAKLSAGAAPACPSTVIASRSPPARPTRSG